MTILSVLRGHGRKRRLRRAFTLVELLVVIGIIALLISILLPALSKARESSNTVKCLANLRSFGQAAMNYAADNQGYMVPGQWQKTADNTIVDDYSWGGNEAWCNIFVQGGYLIAPDATGKGPQTDKN